MAAWVLAHPDRVTPGQLTHARNVLAGTARTRGRGRAWGPKTVAALAEIERLRARNAAAAAPMGGV